MMLAGTINSQRLSSKMRVLNFAQVCLDIYIELSFELFVQGVLHSETKYCVGCLQQQETTLNSG
jgi:hypothetical protein